jgi:hypothetical protein
MVVQKMADKVSSEQAASRIEIDTHKTVGEIKQELKSRAFRAGTQLFNASQIVLRGQRSGRRYRMPNTGPNRNRRHRDKTTGRMVSGVYYTASAPGEAPANRTGAFRSSWHQRVYADESEHEMTIHTTIESNYSVNGKLLGDILEDGTRDGRIAPRPYKDKVKDRAAPTVRKIYKSPF